MKIFLSIALGAASMVSTAVLAPVNIMAQAAQPAQPAPVAATAVSLETKLDTKVAKVGDVVSVRLLQDATVGGTKFPSGSHLMGKITSADPGSLALVFDSIQVKKDPPVPTHAGLAAIAGTYDSYAAPGAPPPDPLAMTQLGSTIKGITLTTGKTADVSGTLTGAPGFKLDKGTRMWVGIF